MKEFTKSELKNRMVVEYRNGEQRMVVGDVLIGYNNHSCLDYYDNELKRKDIYNRQYDITKVYDRIRIWSDVTNHILNLIWERPEVKEVTMAEVEEKFGCKVKIVKDK